uniref:Uncharacterized protein n=1 Tax=Rhizophora mucronata TaxID=61149 RepID=A0A2P2N8P2_RHIMU
MMTHPEAALLLLHSLKYLLLLLTNRANWPSLLNSLRDYFSQKDQTFALPFFLNMYLGP